MNSKRKNRYRKKRLIFFRNIALVMVLIVGTTAGFILREKSEPLPAYAKNVTFEEVQREEISRKDGGGDSLEPYPPIENGQVHGRIKESVEIPAEEQEDKKDEENIPQKEDSKPLETEVKDESLKDKKLIAITFDDGPHETLTPRLLDILKKEDVKATFFVLGSRAKYHPDILKRAADEGHQIGSHTYNHKELPKLSEHERLKEIKDTADLIEQTIGKRPSAMRPPYGSISDSVKKDAGALLILWSIDPEDWKYRDADTVYHNVTGPVRDGDIILLHDIHKTSVDATEKIIPKLKEEGYIFVTVNQLIGARGEAVNGAVYNSLRPK